MSAASLSLAVMSASNNIAALLDSKSVREWREEARLHGMETGTYMDSVVAEYINTRYLRGFIDEDVRDILRKEWCV